MTHTTQTINPGLCQSLTKSGKQCSRDPWFGVRLCKQHQVIKMITMSRDELDQNMQDVRHAIAEQELSGLTVPQETVDDLHRVARGEITTEQVRENIRRRYVPNSKSGQP